MIAVLPAASSLTQGHAEGAMGGRPMGGGGMRPISGPGTVPNPGQLQIPTRFGPGTVPNPGQLPHHPFDGTPGGFPIRDRHRGGVIVDQYSGFETYGGAPTPDETPDDGEGPLPPPTVIPAPTCAPAPQIIKVGRGLLHPARTRIVYGQSPCGY